MDTSSAHDHTTEVAAGEADTSARTHDVYFRTSERLWFFYNAYRGVTLAADHIAWTFNNKDDSAWYRSIVEVRLQTGGRWLNPAAAGRRRLPHLAACAHGPKKRAVNLRSDEAAEGTNGVT
jgi:hypothetical protein